MDNETLYLKRYPMTFCHQGAWRQLMNSYNN